MKHLDGLVRIYDIELAALVTPDPSQGRAAAERYGVASVSTRLRDVLERDDVDAVILCTPTPLHARQAIDVMRAGKHVQVEIPVADSWDDAEAVARAQLDTDRICIVGHTRRFNPSHRWIRARIQAGEFRLQHLDVQTYFLRRSNLNALNQPRTWTDHLLWHHAAHTVDLVRYQTGEEIVAANALQGPLHPELGIAMDMSVQLLTSGGSLCTLSLSFPGTVLVIARLPAALAAGLQLCNQTTPDCRISGAKGGANRGRRRATQANLRRQLMQLDGASGYGWRHPATVQLRLVSGRPVRRCPESFSRSWSAADVVPAVTQSAIPRHIRFSTSRGSPIIRPFVDRESAAGTQRKIANSGR